MKLTRIISVAAIAILAAGCGATDVSTPDSGISMLTFNIEEFRQDASTKTTTSLSGTELISVWDEEDKIGVFPDMGGDQVSFTVTGGAGTSSCTFDGSGWGLMSAARYSAYYPFDASCYGDADTYKSIELSYLGQSQTVKNCFCVGAYDFLACTKSAPSFTDSKRTGGTCTFNFSHLGALVILDITFPKAASLSTLEIVSSDDIFTDKGTVDLSEASAAITSTVMGGTLRLDLGGMTVADGETVRYFMMSAPTSPGSATAAVKATTTSGEVMAQQLSTTLNLQAGKATHIIETLEGESEDDYPAYSQGFKLTFQMDGIEKIEIECVDGYPLDIQGNPIITFAENLEAGKEYTIGTVPCNVYGGYRLSIFKDDQVAHFFGVHQVIEEGIFISPLDLDESELEFDDPDAPLVEEERPELDKKTKELLRIYKQNPTGENYQALYDQMGVRYDKVVARKKAKLRELEREAKHQSLVEEMQGIVEEMVTNREERLWQRFLSLIDSRKDDDATDQWLILKGAWEENAYIGYAPITNAEYKAFKTDYEFPDGQERYPVVNISYYEALDYCNWLSAGDASHAYRLPTEYEWILAAGHMPKDVNMNAGQIESGLTSVDAYASSIGNCGGIDFWGNCWEWTATQTEDGKYLIKGGAWDSSRDECRSEYSDASRDGSKGYANVGFRVVRVDASGN